MSKWISRFIEKLSVAENTDDLKKEFESEVRNMSEREKDAVFFHVFLFEQHKDILRNYDRNVETIKLMQSAWRAKEALVMAQANLIFESLKGKVGLFNLSNPNSREKFAKISSLYQHMIEAEKQIKAANPELTDEQVTQIANDYYHKIAPKFNLD